MCPKWIPKGHNWWADRKKSLLYWLTKMSLFLSQSSHTSGASLMLVKHVGLELLEITFSAQFLPLFSLFFCLVSPTPFFPFFGTFWDIGQGCSQQTSGVFECFIWLGFRESWFALRQHFFPSYLKGEPQMSGLTHLTSTCLRCHRRKAELSSSDAVIREMSYICGHLRRDCGKAKDIISSHGCMWTWWKSVHMCMYVRLS